MGKQAKGKGGKGKGKHIAKQEKYANYKVGSNRKGINRKQTGGIITLRNTAKKAKRHQKKISDQVNNCDKRKELTSQLLHKFAGKKYSELSRQFGTLNIRRLRNILDDTYEFRLWYLDRVKARKEHAEKKKELQTVRKHVKFHKSNKKKDKKPKESESKNVSRSTN